MAKIKLVENVLVPASKVQKLDIPLTEASVEGTPYKALAVYRFPFTRPGQKNLNGRIYPFKLWDRIFQLFRTKSTVALCNHPEDDGDPARIWAVLRNPGYNSDRTLGMVDCYILDNELGRTANGILLAGGDIGLSSSGVGDFEVDGITVDADTYELERFFDWVLNPSYSVFGSLDDKISEAAIVVPIKDNEIANDKVQESTGGGYMKQLSLREKRELEASFKRIYEDVKSITNVRERLNRANEALTFYEDTDVTAYKGDFAELVKEAEKEFEATFAKCEQADTAKKEAEEFSQTASKAKKEAEALKKENDNLKKENEKLKKQVEESTKLKNETNGLLSSLTESMRRNIPYEKYEELQQYAIKATKLYSEMKSEKNILQIKVQEMIISAKALEEAQMLQYRKDATARARIEEQRQKNAEAKMLSEKKLQEAKEAEFMRNVNPEVLEYYNDTVNRGVSISEFKTQILSKRTLEEAQLLVLKATRKSPIVELVQERDLSVPLPVKNCRQILPEKELMIPKGYI